ncbi:MAG: Gfo/Idh/MocA family oxidoreductase [Bacteroidales bacterium]|nr:Gfo/Idh/MocA family oxidoreductase [Bacteroidales bacterium]
MKKIGTALLSYGMSGRVFHAPFLSVHGGFNLIGAWERNHKGIEADHPGVKSYESLEEVVADENIELVVVNTPTYTHFEYASKVLKAGKHIIVEKAFTTTTVEAITLAKLAEEKGLKIGVYQNRRWDSELLTALDVLNSKVLGDIIEAEIRFERYRPEVSPKKHKEEPNAGAGLLMDLGPHAIDQAISLFGMPEAVFADLRITRKQSLVDDYFDILLYYADKRVRLKSGFFVKEPAYSHVLHGTLGSFLKPRADVQEEMLLKGFKPEGSEWGKEADGGKGLIHYTKNGETIRDYIPSRQGNYMTFYEGVFGALRHDQPMPVTAIDGYKVMVVIEAALKSNREKKAISF